MNHKKHISTIFLVWLSFQFGFAQQIDRILPYNNYDTTGVYLIFDGTMKYEKEIRQSPPSLSLIFPNTQLTEGNYQKMVDMPPLFRIEARETINSKYYKHAKVSLYFSEIPEFKIDQVGENVLRIIWSASHSAEDFYINEVDDESSKLEIWTSFENVVTMNLKDAELIDILRLMAMQSGMNLITSDEITGKVTLTLTDVSVGSALDAMLKVNGYDWFIQENLIVVKPIDEDVVGGLVTKHYKLEYADAFSVGTALSNVLTEKGKFQVFSPVAASSYFGSNMAGGMQGGMQSGMGGLSGGMGGAQSGMGGAQSGMGGVQSGMGGARSGMGGAMGGAQGMQSMMTADYILVTDVYANFDHIESIIRQLDIKVQQINISVKFVETKLNVNERLGIDWTLRSEMIGPVPEPDASIVDFEEFKLFDSNSLNLYAFSLPAFESVLEMLASDNETRLIQEPQITTKNNTVATFKVGTTYPVLTTSTTDIAQTTSFEDKEINIILKVQPRINEEQYISLDISTTVQALVGFSGPNGDIPIISDRATTTHVRVEDQRTLMIGGLIFDQAIESNKKIPFISSIPLLGKLFTHTTYTTEQRELLIFITPSIIHYN
ncbi:MAG: type II and III secretion system protein [Candidatus Neomarinimicrobiota bacterium]